MQGKVKGNVLYGGLSRSLNNQCDVGAVCGTINSMSRPVMLLLCNITTDYYCTPNGIIIGTVALQGDIYYCFIYILTCLCSHE